MNRPSRNLPRNGVLRSREAGGRSSAAGKRPDMKAADSSMPLHIRAKLETVELMPVTCACQHSTAEECATCRASAGQAHRGAKLHKSWKAGPRSRKADSVVASPWKMTQHRPDFRENGPRPKAAFTDS